MRKIMTVLCGLSLIGGMLVMPQPSASAGGAGIDKELLGVRLLQSFKRVLELYGQPTRIFRADESVNLLFAYGPDGKETGGVTGIGEAGQAAGGPGAAGGGPMSGGPMSGGPMGGGRAMAGGGKGEDLPGFPMSGGAPGSAGGRMGGGALGSGPAGGDKSPTFSESGGFTWVYHYPKDELAYIFFFNKDGRVEMISEYGRYKGKPSSRGIKLGDIVRNVYSVYGWPDTVEPQVSAISLNYNIKSHALFNVLNGKVTGISVILQESNYPHLVGASQSTAGGPGAMGGSPMSGGAMGGGPIMGSGGGRPAIGGGPVGMSGGRMGGGKMGAGKFGGAGKAD